MTRGRLARAIAIAAAALVAPLPFADGVADAQPAPPLQPPPPPGRFARPPPTVFRPSVPPPPGAPAPEGGGAPEENAAASTSITGTPDLRAHFGAEIAARLLRSDDPAERLRGIARAAAAGTPDAVALLVQAAEPSGPFRGDTRATIDLARALAPWADQPPVRLALLAIVNAATPSASAHDRGDDARGAHGGIPIGAMNMSAQAAAAADARAAAAGLGIFADDGDHAARAQLARGIAALALASTRETRTFEGLLALARAGGPGQSAAIAALGALPPSPALVFGRGMLTSPPIMRLAAQLGDVRAIDGIRQELAAPEATVRASALVTLAELGDGRVADAARASRADHDPRVRAAAAEALVLIDAPERVAAVEALFGDDATVHAAARLAERVSSPAIVRALASRAAGSADPDLRAEAIAALGRSADPETLRALAALLRDPVVQGDAAQAIARSAAPGALAVVDRMIAEPRTSRLGVRAGVVRALTRGETSDALRTAAKRMAASTSDGDARALGVFARVALGDVAAEDALGDSDPRVRRAAAMASLAHPDERSRHALLARLAHEPDATTRQVLGVGLAAGDPRAQTTTLALLDRAQAGESDGPLAAMALAARIDAPGDARVDALLTSGDRLVRAHAARGLGLSAAPDALGRLAAAYTYEAEPSVRRAIVEALARRAQSSVHDEAAIARLGTLETAARLDPDRGVRWAATHGGSSEPGAGSQVAWIRLATADGGAPPRDMLGAFVRSDGLAVPVAFDADGYALVPGVPPGEGRLVLAPRVSAYQDARR